MHSFIQVWPAQITQSFELCIFLKTITPESFEPKKKGTENTNRNTKEVFLIKAEDGSDV